MKETLLVNLKNSKEYTLAVAQAMPGSGYTWKPTTKVWSFGELLWHIAYGINWWQQNYILGVKEDWAPPAVKGTKDETIKYIEHSYAALKKTIEEQDINDQVMAGFYATLDHITHHRGEAIVYLQSNDIIPPEYRF